MAKKITKQSGDEVAEFMFTLKHPLKAEMETLRKIIQASDKEISERFKWKAPSYHLNQTDFLTFNPRDLKKIHLVFHHPEIENIDSPLLEGDYKGRRMTYFKNDTEIEKNKKELQRVIKVLLKKIRG